jgi:hypothetical protein
MNVNKRRLIVRKSHVEVSNGRKYQAMEGSFIPSCTYNLVLQVEVSQLSTTCAVNSVVGFYLQDHTIFTSANG